MPAVHHWCLLAWSLLAGASAAGSAGCPCLESFEAYGLPNNKPLDVTVAKVKYTYPAGYGLGECKAHDQTLSPYCGKVDAPDWCADKWCYIEPANCNLVASQSTFLSEDLFYSYRTCGDTNTFDSWFGKGGSGSGGSGSSHSLVELVGLITGYLKATVNALEMQEVELRTADISAGCTYSPSCDCCGCKENEKWSGEEQNAISFTSPTITPFKDKVAPGDSPANIDVCLSSAIATQFQHVAAKEADVNRIGYEYFGSQMGTYMQWPGVQWCPEGYDPRFRNWYAGGVSGPKDMVIVIDTSGSMSGSRIRMAREAATRVIDTLTESDYATIVKFSSAASSSYMKLERMTAARRKAAKQWIERNIDASGGTNFRDALAKVWDVLSKSTTSTSKCNRLILFLSDGKPQGWEEADYAAALDQTKLHNAHILTYALGSGADADILKRLACESRGIFYPVSDSDNLGDVMASYYYLVSAMLEPCQVRFTEYEDWFTKETLLAACLPAYKRADSSDPLTCSAVESGSGGFADGSVPHLIGVSCMDMSLVASKSQLEANAGFKDFWTAVTAQMASCPLRTLSDASLQELRAQVSPRSVCGTGTGTKPSNLKTSSSYELRTSQAKKCVVPGSATESSELGSASNVTGIAIGASIGAVVACCAAYVICLQRVNKKRDRGVPGGMDMQAATPEQQPVNVNVSVNVQGGTQAGYALPMGVPVADQTYGAAIPVVDALPVNNP